MTIPEQLLFVFLPIRISIIFCILLFSVIRIIRTQGNIDIFFSVNAFTAWIGNILRSWKLVTKTIFWVWDYYPPTHNNPIIAYSRWLYWVFDKKATTGSNVVVFLNQRLRDVRKNVHMLPDMRHTTIVPIGTDPVKTIHRVQPIRFVFFAVLKKSQGLDLFFDMMEHYSLPIKNASLHVIGGGPDRDYFEQRAKKCSIPVHFHGYVKDDHALNTIMATCHIGLATYIPETSNVSSFTDPSKIKRYISFAIPVITTTATGFAEEIHESGAGVVISYNKAELKQAIRKIVRNYPTYQKHALSLAKKYTYSTIYKKLFAEV